MTRATASTSTKQRKLAGRQTRPAVTRALSLLEAVAAAGRPTTLNEIAVTQDVPIATAFRLCQRLEDAGYLVRGGGQEAG